ncbi:MAG: UvrD-helicase domain-containing protein, partial [Clostridia bacterium]|nr:UvrD-helicase domain-containing protein [Clostridia bacterium]
MDLLSNLNEVQRQIVTDTEGKLLVLAGAGSGKTRVLTHRVAYLVAEKGVWGSNILAITFTNKATAEMRERLDDLLGLDHGVWISTIHSLAARILRRFGEYIGYDKNFSIYDESDSARMIAKVVTEAQIDDNRIKEALKEHIGKAKNDGMSPEEYFHEINGLVNDAELIVKLFARYEELLKQNNAMDFDDLLHKLKKLLLTSEECLNFYQNKFRYIHVDEFQDTNKVQYEIIKLLAGKWGNLFVVGDDDQSIYGWRGAKVENILNFDKEFKDAKVYKLLENYRSTEEILNCANNVIQNNKARHEKRLFTNRGKGLKVEYYNAWNDRNEAEWVVGKIESLIYYNGYRKKDFAILVRANSLTRMFEQMLQSTRLTYRVVGGFKFFDRKEIQDVIAYMRAVANARDNAALERIINFPQRGIGDATIDKLDIYSRESQISTLNVLLSLNDHATLL